MAYERLSKSVISVEYLMISGLMKRAYLFSNVQLYIENNNEWIIWNIWSNQYKTGTVTITRKYSLNWMILISKLTLSGSGPHLYRKIKTMRKPWCTIQSLLPHSKCWTPEDLYTGLIFMILSFFKDKLFSTENWRVIRNKLHHRLFCHNSNLQIFLQTKG